MLYARNAKYDLQKYELMVMLGYAYFERNRNQEEEH